MTLGKLSPIYIKLGKFYPRYNSVLDELHSACKNVYYFC